MGASPPGPGKISSSLFKVSSASVISVARKADSNCPIVRGPMMGAVTIGLCKSQAKATAAGIPIITLNSGLDDYKALGAITHVGQTEKIAGVAAGAGGLCALANVALTLHDGHVDLTREKIYTPSAAAMRVVEGLGREVRVTYFYHSQDPAGRRARDILDVM